MVAATDISVPPGFYTAHDASRIARIPLNTLYSWGRKGLIHRRVTFIDEDGKEERGYDYESLLLARLLRILRQNGIGMRRAVATLRHCMDRFGSPGPAWAEVKVFSFEGADVVTYRADEWDSTVPTKSGQKVAEELFGEEFTMMKEDADALLIPKQFLCCVHIDPHIRDGMPVVRGSAIETGTLREFVNTNWTPRLIVDKAYPHLDEERVECALAYEQFLDDE